MKSNRSVLALSTAILVVTSLTGVTSALAQKPAAIPPSLVTPDKVETRIGPLEYKDGAPNAATVREGLRHPRFHPRRGGVYEQLLRCICVCDSRGFPMASGLKDNTVVIFSDLMDSNSLFLTANCDTVYNARGPRPDQGTDWSSKCRRCNSAPSTTCGSAGSSISARPDQIAAKVANISSCRRAMTARCRIAASLSGARKPHACSLCSARLHGEQRPEAHR